MTVFTQSAFKFSESSYFNLQFSASNPKSVKMYMKWKFRQQFHCPLWKCVKRQNKWRLPFVNNLSTSKVMMVWSSQNQMKEWQEIEQKSIRID